jgi:GH43 family beta-xylosidase
MRRAKTIIGLKEAEEKVIWWKHEDKEMSKHIWAPEINFIDGK